MRAEEAVARDKENTRAREVLQAQRESGPDSGPDPLIMAVVNKAISISEDIAKSQDEYKELFKGLTTFPHYADASSPASLDIKDGEEFYRVISKLHSMDMVNLQCTRYMNTFTDEIQACVDEVSNTIVDDYTQRTDIQIHIERQAFLLQVFAYQEYVIKKDK